tara:strand:- start:795 stop:908 length:114 start_codon:yes stop_codon:yes gene_type:complete
LVAAEVEAEFVVTLLLVVAEVELVVIELLFQVEQKYF